MEAFGTIDLTVAGVSRSLIADPSKLTPQSAAERVGSRPTERGSPSSPAIVAKADVFTPSSSIPFREACAPHSPIQRRTRGTQIRLKHENAL